MDTIPPQSPPITPDPVMTEVWKARLRTDPAKLKVGLVWAGNQFPIHNRKRSTSLESLLPLSHIEGVSFYSLQKGAAADPKAATAMRLRDFTAELNDFSDTAALISALDLVISIDTGVAHLAGAMEKRVWTLLPAVPDWRYFLETTDSPWYRTMRLYRQASPGDWTTPVSEISRDLRQLVNSSTS